MDVEIIKKSDTKIATWSGGTTSEIFIYPKESSLEQRDFNFRLSIATVEIEESDFTCLPNVNRTLMVLKGNLSLMHENQHTVQLKEFEQDSFKGDWNTKSKGKVTDFNLMTKGNYVGTLTHIQFYESEKVISLSHFFDLFYVVNGSVIIENYVLNQGEMIKFNQVNKTILIQSKNANVIQISINMSC
jgi:environmental stress-induced protein Ves